MDYSKFYTPPLIAKALISQMNIPHPPKSAIDICCGSCNLLHAVSRKWPSTETIGVDVSPSPSKDINVINSDGRDFALKTSMRFPVVVANPPFAYVQTKNEYPELYKDIFQNYRTSRLENEMLLANLMLLKKNGTLMAIMPSTFVEAEANKSLRKLLASQYHIHKIIKLPSDAFAPATIQSYALYILNDSSSHHATVNYKLTKTKANQFKAQFINRISYRAIQEGNWAGEKSILQSYDIRRGNISSNLFVDSGTPVLHTAKKDPKWRPSIRYVKELPKRPVIVHNGDLIISRVGKSAGSWTIHYGKPMAITDCLYRLSNPPNLLIHTKQEYDSVFKGVATRYITIADFEHWIDSLSG